MPISKSRLGRLRFRQLQLFEQLFETGSIRNAALRIGVTQPAASEMLREIESIFGIPLFERARRGVIPLPGAHVLLERVRISLRELESVGAELEVTAKGGLPRLRVGAVQHAVVQLFPQAISEMLNRPNAARIVLREDSINDLLEQLELGELDCVVGRLSPDHFAVESMHPLSFWLLVDDPLSVVCAASHPLAKRRKVVLSDLLEYSWVLPPAVGLTTKLVHQAFLRAGLPVPPTLVESEKMASSLAICSGTELLTVAASEVARRQEKLGLVRVLPIDFDLGAPPLAMICRSGSANATSVVAFREALMRVAGPLAARVRKKSAPALRPPPTAETPAARPRTSNRGSRGAP